MISMHTEIIKILRKNAGENLMKGSLVSPFSAQSYILEGFVKATTGR